MNFGVLRAPPKKRMILKSLKCSIRLEFNSEPLKIYEELQGVPIFTFERNKF